MSSSISQQEIRNFLDSIANGEVHLEPLEEPFLGSGNVPYQASNGWRLVVFNDANFWDYIQEVVTDDGRIAVYEELKSIDYVPSEDIAWRRYLMPGLTIRCPVCQQEGLTIEHPRGICCAWLENWVYLDPPAFPSAIFAKYLIPRDSDAHLDVRKQGDFSQLSQKHQMLTVRFWLDNKELPALPDKLLHLALFNYERLEHPPELPTGLKALTVSGGDREITLPELPAGLECLGLLNFRAITNLHTLPSGLKHLTLSSPWLAKIPELPTSLEELEINLFENSERTQHVNPYSQELKLPALPSGLTKVRLIDCPSLKPAGKND